MAASTGKTPIAVLIGNGSKLPVLVKNAKINSSKFEIKLVVSHKSHSPGVDFAVKNKIPAVHFKLLDYKNRLLHGQKKSRAEYMKNLGWFISQKEYNPRLLVFAGWDLIMDKNFFNFFPCSFGSGYSAINLHPAILPKVNEGQKIKTPDGQFTPIIKGEQTEVLETVLKKQLSYFGPTVHFMVANAYDTGEVIEREFIKVGSAKTIGELQKKLMPVEDEILVSALNKVIDKYII